MSDKRLDLSVLPDRFLIEYAWKREGKRVWCPEYMNKLDAKVSSVKPYRPALNYWHFTDNCIALPDGLICHCLVVYPKDLHLSRVEDLSVEDINLGSMHGFRIVAIKIIGVTKEYENHGKELGMEVIEI